MKGPISWQSKGGCCIPTMKSPPRSDVAWSSSGRSWGSRRCRQERGKPATAAIRSARGACSGREIRQGRLRVRTHRGGWTARTTVRMSVIIPGRGAGGPSHLCWRLAALFRNSEHPVLAPDGAVSDICQRLRRAILVEGIRLSVGTYCWTFHRSADKLRPSPSYSRRRDRDNCVRNLITYEM